MSEAENENEIEKIPTQELINDGLAVVADIQLCERALAFGIEAGSIPVSTRLSINIAVLSAITDELEKRKGVLIKSRLN